MESRITVIDKVLFPMIYNFLPRDIGIAGEGEQEPAQEIEAKTKQ